MTGRRGDRVTKLVKTAVSRAIGPHATIQERIPLGFQSNQLFDVWWNGRHFIAKHFLKNDELADAPRREFEALQLLVPLDAQVLENVNQ